MLEVESCSDRNIGHTFCIEKCLSMYDSCPHAWTGDAPGHCEGLRGYPCLFNSAGKKKSSVLWRDSEHEWFHGVAHCLIRLGLHFWEPRCNKQQQRCVSGQSLLGVRALYHVALYPWTGCLPTRGYFSAFQLSCLKKNGKKPILGTLG